MVRQRWPREAFGRRQAYTSPSASSDCQLQHQHQQHHRHDGYDDGDDAWGMLLLRMQALTMLGTKTLALTVGVGGHGDDNGDDDDGRRARQVVC